MSDLEIPFEGLRRPDTRQTRILSPASCLVTWHGTYFAGGQYQRRQTFQTLQDAKRFMLTDDIILNANFSERVWSNSGLQESRPAFREW